MACWRCSGRRATRSISCEPLTWHSHWRAPPCSSPARGSRASPPRRDLFTLGADVTVIDARDRVGGRVWTIRDGFPEGQHAEAGGDMIDEAHTRSATLCKELGLKLTRILRGGFGYVGPTRPGSRASSAATRRAAGSGWRSSLGDVARPYRLAEQRWDSPIAGDLARRSVAQWLDEVGADDELRATTRGLRGFFLADPGGAVAPRARRSVRPARQPDGPLPCEDVPDRGRQQSPGCRAGRALGDRVRLNTELVAVSHRGKGVRATLKHGRTVSPDLLRLSGPGAAGDHAATRPDHACPAGASSTTRSRG